MKESGKKYSFTEYSYDAYFYNLIKELKSVQEPKQADSFLLAESKKGPLEMVGNSYVLFRYGEYYILSSLANTGEKVVKDYEIVNSLHLTIFPRLIEYFVLNENFYIITKIPHNTSKNIAECSSPIAGDASDAAKRIASSELVLLEQNGYVLLPTFRFSVRINEDGNIMIPEFELMTLAEATEKGIMGDVHARYRMFETHGDNLGHLEFVARKVRFYPEDIDKMKNMSLEEKVEFKAKLKAEKRYTYED